ncbi:uncharacterized protein HfgLR_25195 (plasmid) [Haloferax gibbonsii]|uniref:Uncharacterized protein n=1 Tax=Haloferax gibbonsii TaxID=35746 RepID=A0A871BLV7_HALGI|nr:hypothetical protein [Haloferax gibbonsii]QOS14117.1 uncharacterized protein HfgLR_25195 [Haloferax gibbonsii]
MAVDDCGQDDAQNPKSTCPNPNDLPVGATFELPTSTELVLVGRTDDLDDGHGPLYEFVMNPDGGDETRRTTYRGYHLDTALVSGAVYSGVVDVQKHERGAPFQCPGCEQVYTSDARRDVLLSSEVVCSYGCERSVIQDRVRNVIERTPEVRQ